METKTCTKCNIAFEKTTDHFELRRKKRKSGNGYCEYFRARCKTCRREYKRVWMQTPIGRAAKKRQRDRWKKTPAGIASKKRHKQRYRKKPYVRIRANCSKRLKEFLSTQGVQKDRSSSKYFDFTPRQLQEHLESQFTSEMSWDNYGTYWHIDHIIPLAYYGISDSDDPKIREAWKLENLMPLEAKENMRKGSNYNGVQHLYKKT